MRQNGHGTLTFEDARTWIEETGLCLFLPRRQFSSSVAPSFVEALAGQRDAAPDPRPIAAAEEFLVRLEQSDVAVRLNLQGLPGEQPDFVVASWVLPYVYALRGDRDWRRSPQLTGSRAVSQLAVQAYKHLETGDMTIVQLRQALGREVTEAAVVRAITELWQQLRIIPVIAAMGQPAKWQLLRHRFQKAIAEGASTSQVTAISVLASIYLQAVIAAGMEEVELFLSPLTARSKVREVLRGLVATRQVHTIAMGPTPQFYVAGTLPEFQAATSIYTGATMPGSNYHPASFEREESAVEPPASAPAHAVPAHAVPVHATPVAAHARHETRPQAEMHTPRTPVHTPVRKPAAARPHSRPAPHTHDRKPGANRTGSSRTGSNRTGSNRNGASHPAASRPSSSRTAASRPGTSRPGTSRGPQAANGSRPASASRWAKPSAAGRSANGKSNGHHAAPGNNGHGNGHSNGKGPNRTNGTTRTNGSGLTGARAANGKPGAGGKSAAPSWAKSNGHAKKNGKPLGKAVKSVGGARTDARTGARKPALTAGAKGGNGKRYGFVVPSKPKKRG
jgi:hypothetical protein